MVFKALQVKYKTYLFNANYTFYMLYVYFVF